MPRVSVLMPAYNAESYVGDAVESVLGQTFEDFEFIIVEDASTDATPEILESYAVRDHRIRLIRNEANLGLIRSLNRGLELAKGEFVARIDADDLCRPQRLERQVSFLDDNSDHVLVGASYDAIDEQGRLLWSKITTYDDVQVRWIARFRVPLGHSGATFRRLGPSGQPWQYDERFEAAEDYDLWQRMMQCGRAAVLPDLLFAYRFHDRTITAAMGPLMARNTFTIALRHARLTLPGELIGTMSEFLRSYLTREPMSPQGIVTAVRLFDEMLRSDIAAFPQHRSWFRTQSAGVLMQGVLERGGAARDWRHLRAFVMAAWRHLPWLAARALEDGGASFFLLRRRAFGR